MKKMIKKLSWIFCITYMSCILSGCRDKENTIMESNADKNDFVEEELYIKKGEPDKSVDIDLSIMNFTMISSITFNMMVSPELFNGKRVKISGYFYTVVEGNKRYFSVVLWDPTGCCPAGMDFIPPASMKYPEDFPEAKEMITVIGTLKYADETGTSLLFLADEVWESL